MLRSKLLDYVVHRRAAIIVVSLASAVTSLVGEMLIPINGNIDLNKPAGAAPVPIGDFWFSTSARTSLWVRYTHEEREYSVNVRRAALPVEVCRHKWEYGFPLVSSMRCASQYAASSSSPAWVDSAQRINILGKSVLLPSDFVILGLVVNYIFYVTFFAVIYISLLLLRFKSNRRHSVCAFCGYSLTGIALGRCPECGKG